MIIEMLYCEMDGIREKLYWEKKVMHSRKEEQQARRVLLIIGVAALVLVVAMLVGYSFLG